MATLNRDQIRNALKAYKESRRQHDAILADDEVQTLAELGKYDKVNAIIAERHPLGNWDRVQGTGLRLIEAMKGDIPQLADLDPWDAWANVTAFNKFVELAEQV